MDQRNMSDCTGCQNLSNMWHQGTREMCQIVQDVRTCLICHTKGPEKYVRLYRMSDIQVLTSCTIWHISLVHWCDVLDRFWHPVQSDTFLWSLGVTYWTGSDILYNLTHFSGPLVWHIRQVMTSCTIWHISLVHWCDVIDRFWHPVQSDTFLWSLGVTWTCLIRHTKGPEKCVRLYRMSEPV
jgi:hypothetical protein